MKLSRETAMHPGLPYVVDQTGKTMERVKNLATSMTRSPAVLINQFRQALVSAAMVIGITALFISASYLFLVQLAEYGW